MTLFQQAVERSRLCIFTEFRAEFRGQYTPFGTGDHAGDQVRSSLTLYCQVSHKTKSGRGEPVRAMMWNQRCDRIGNPAEAISP